MFHTGDPHANEAHEEQALDIGVFAWELFGK
jgi:hypothetical protein